MKAAILTILLLTPVSLAIIYRPPPRKPPFDRKANERRVAQLRSMISEVDAGSRAWIGPWPEQPEGYPNDPDCLSSSYEP